MIHELVKQDLKIAIKGKNDSKVAALRYILGEFTRLKGTKVGGKSIVGDILSDPQAISVIKKVIVSERKLQDFGGNVDLKFIHYLDTYLPKMVNSDVVTNWVQKHIDFSKFKNKMQAVGIVKAHFGTSVDGALVSNLIKNWELNT